MYDGTSSNSNHHNQQQSLLLSNLSPRSVNMQAAKRLLSRSSIPNLRLVLLSSSITCPHPCRTSLPATTPASSKAAASRLQQSAADDENTSKLLSPRRPVELPGGLLGGQSAAAAAGRVTSSHHQPMSLPGSAISMPSRQMPNSRRWEKSAQQQFRVSSSNAATNRAAK